LNIHPTNLPEGLIGQASEKFSANGEVMDQTAKKLLAHLLKNLVDWTRKLSA
jgi:hypothetical protein